MKVFATREVEAAVAYSLAGNLALHLHRIIPNRATAPRCFVNAVDNGHPIAHLFHQSELVLLATARKLGVRVMHIDRRGTDRMHIDLVGNPLRKALEMCDDQQRVSEILAQLAASWSGS